MARSFVGELNEDEASATIELLSNAPSNVDPE
jgi:hypothetical protein